MDRSIYDLTNKAAWYILAGLALNHPTVLQEELESLYAFLEKNPEKRREYLSVD